MRLHPGKRRHTRGIQNGLSPFHKAQPGPATHPHLQFDSFIYIKVTGINNSQELFFLTVKYKIFDLSFYSLGITVLEPETKRNSF